MTATVPDKVRALAPMTVLTKEVGGKNSHANGCEPAGADLDRLTSLVRGPVFGPGDPGLAAELATHNLTYPIRPAVTVGALDAADVSAAVRWAADHGRRVAVHATGHGSVGPVDGAVLISTRRMDTLRVDPAARTATVGAGVRFSSVIEATTPHGLAPLNGSTSHAGVVGYTVGGGVGPMGRRYGFAADHVRRFEIVTADGRRRQVDADHEPELFWAVRGGKGNFGIVTELDFDLLPVGRLYGGGLFYPGEHAAAVLHRYREWVATLSERTTTSIALLRLPPLPTIPEPLRGRFVVQLRVAHLGHAGEGVPMLAPMRRVAPPIIDGVSEIPYAAVDSIHGDPTDPVPSFDRGTALAQLPAAAVDAMLAVAGPGVDVPLIVVELRHLGGALARPAAVPNAVAGRDAAFSLLALGPMAGPLVDVVPALTQSVIDAVAPWSTGGALLNFLGPADEHRVRSLWGSADRQRLAGVKSAVDPTNVFSFGSAMGV